MILNLVKVKEGQTEILVPEHEKGLGPKSSKNDIFYNPAMELNRDISVAFLKAFDCDELKVLDGMAASGVRGIRIAKEVGVKKIVLTDLSEESVSLIRKNIEKAGVEAEAINESIEEHLLHNRHYYDYIDVDPFGSPVKYFPIAARFVKRGGIVAVSATDTAVLCGTYPEKCYRLYSSWPENNWCRHENGVRILIAYCAREAARFQRSIEPLLSYYDGHHFRTYLKIDESAKKADEALSKLSKFEFSDIGWGRDPETGPFWAGDIFDMGTLEEIRPLGTLDNDLLDLWRDEGTMPPFFYDTNILGMHTKSAPPPLDNVVDSINSRAEGWKATKTHFSPTGFKTDAPEKEVLEIFSNI